MGLRSQIWLSDWTELKKILESVAISSSRGISPISLGMEPASRVSPALAGGFFTTSATQEALENKMPTPKSVVFLLVAQMEKNLPAMWKTWVWSLDCKGPLEKEMATHSSIHAWRIPWTEEPGGYSPWGLKESDITEQWTHTHNIVTVINTSPSFITLLSHSTPKKINCWLIGSCKEILLLYF